MKVLQTALLLLTVPALYAPALAGTVKVAGTATGGFGLNPLGPTNGATPMVAAISVMGPGSITISSKSGLVNYGGPGPVVKADGGDFGQSPNSSSLAWPLDEAVGITSAAYPGQEVIHMAALIGAFIPTDRAAVAGFAPVDATKGLAAAGILPSDLFFVGSYHVLIVSGPGTLYLGINDCYPGDNSGQFLVNVSAP